MRVTTIGSSGKTAPVQRARCSRTQQLSGPLTKLNRCVTSQLVVPVGTEVTVADVGDEEPPHAANVNATARARSALKAAGFRGYPLFERDALLDKIRNAPEFVQFMTELKRAVDGYRREFDRVGVLDSPAYRSGSDLRKRRGGTGVRAKTTTTLGAERPRNVEAENDLDDQLNRYTVDAYEVRLWSPSRSIRDPGTAWRRRDG